MITSQFLAVSFKRKDSNVFRCWKDFGFVETVLITVGAGTGNGGGPITNGTRLWKGRGVIACMKIMKFLEIG